jgi:hypothetical protein
VHFVGLFLFITENARSKKQNSCIHATDACDITEILHVLILLKIGASSRWSVGYALLHGGKNFQNSMNRKLAGFQNRTWTLLRRVPNRNDGFVIDVVESSSFSACESNKRELRSFSSVTHTKLSTEFLCSFCSLK